MLKITTPTAWAKSRSPAEWARHHIRVVVALLVLAVVFSYPAGIFFTAMLNSALKRAPPPAVRGAPVRGTGVVTSANAFTGTVSVQHGALPALGLGPATTSFRASPAIIGHSETGDRVSFTLSAENGFYVITEMDNRTSGVVVK